MPADGTKSCPSISCACIRSRTSTENSNHPADVPAFFFSPGGTLPYRYANPDRCDTYGNPPLCSQEQFQVSQVEVRLPFRVWSCAVIMTDFLCSGHVLTFFSSSAIVSRSALCWKKEWRWNREGLLVSPKLCRCPCRDGLQVLSYMLEGRIKGSARFSKQTLRHFFYGSAIGSC